MKHKSKRIIALFVAVVMLVVLVTGCGGTQGTENNQPAKETIIRQTEAAVPVIDPGVGNDYASSVALCNIYDTLVFPTHDGDLEPMLATDWETSDNGLVWTFNLRKGVKFHNGDELTAEDVAFSMQRMLDMGEGYAYLFTDVVKEAKATDTYQVQFTLKKSFGPFLSTLVRLYVLNKDQVMANIDKNGTYGDKGDYGKNWLLTHDAGSGPYMVAELKMQEYLYAKKFPEYWGGWEAGSPDAFKIIGTTSTATIRTMMNRKELEITDQWQTKEALEALDKIDGVDISAIASGTILNLMFNTKKAPLDDIHVRKALTYAFDYDTVVDKLFPGSTKANGPVSKYVPGSNKDLPVYEQNMEKAKEELAKSKYVGQFDKYPIEIAWIAEVPDEEKIALLFQSNAAELGLKVDVVKVPWLTFVDQVSTQENTPHASTVFVTPHYNEAGSILEARYHSKSTGTWEQAEWLLNKEIDAAIEDATSTVDTEARMKKYRDIQAKIVDMAPTIYCFDQAEKRAYQAGYVYWPAAERAKKGEPVSTVMGYKFYYRDFRIDPSKM